jgi:hypothetical protein
MTGRHRPPIEVPEEDLDFEFTQDDGHSHLYEDSAGHRDGLGVARTIMHHAITLMLILGVLGMGAWVFLNFRSNKVPRAAAIIETSNLESDAISGQLQRIRFALEVHRRAKNQYPLTLANLVEQHYLLDSDLNYPAVTYRYLRKSDSYELEPVNAR